MITRRNLLLAAPAIILTPGLLMPVRRIVTPQADIEAMLGKFWDRYRLAPTVILVEDDGTGRFARLAKELNVRFQGNGVMRHKS